MSRPFLLRVGHLIHSFMIDMLMDNAKTFKLNENSYLGLASLISTDYKISGKLTPNKGLSNGDSVRLEWNVNVEKLEKQYHVKMEYEDQVFTVNGLDDAEAYDPFEDISIAARSRIRQDLCIRR